MVGLSQQDVLELQARLQQAVVFCNERCLYQSAKWGAELLNSLADTDTPDSAAADGSVSDSEFTAVYARMAAARQAVHLHPDVAEARLEARELSRFMLAKSFFDCREYDRCAAVFLPPTLPKSALMPPEEGSFDHDWSHHTPQSNPPSSSPPAMPKSRHAGGANNSSRSIGSTASFRTVKGKGKGNLRSATVPLPPVVAAAAKSKGTSSSPVSSRSAKKAPVSSDGVLLNVSQRSLFLALYAKYISGEKRKDEDSEMILGPADGGVTGNKELNGITTILEHWFAGGRRAGGPSQGWLEYLYGIVLAKGKNDELARHWLVKSLHLYPYNWGTWLELSTLVGTVEELNATIGHLPQNIMTFFFHIYTSQELCQSTDQIHREIMQLETIFPGSAFLKTQKALLYYHSKDFEESEAAFSAILREDPHRLDSLDHYSNVLYVMSLRPKLAFLAQLATSTDKFRPETCCVVGNYYSLKSEHEKAVMYFRRALTLDRSFLSAWTLMGHEYVEMKNTHAAIESYRRAVDLNRKDYRGWYGLGQTYEVLEMHSYALFYYQRAASLRPYDPKMWQATGACFGRIGRIDSAIRAYKRALVAGSYYEGSLAGDSFGSQDRPDGGLLDPEVLYQIALLHERLDDRDECAAYMELVLAQEGGDGVVGDDLEDPVGQAGVGITATTSKARMWLARWEFSNGSYQRSMELANELCQDGVEVEEAKALVRDIRARIEHKKDQGAV